MRNLLVLLLLVAPSLAFAQAEPDWISKIKVEPEVQEVVAPPVENDLAAKLDELLQKSESTNREVTQMIFEARAALDKINSFEPITMDQVRTEIDAKIATALLGRPAFTEGEIREFAKDEIQKFHAKVKMPDGSVKTVTADTEEVTAAGHYGTFTVPKGGVVVEVGGVPVRRSAVYSNRNVNTFTADTPVYNLESQPIMNTAQPQPVQVQFYQPLRTAAQTCRQVWNPATRRFERQCN